MSAESASLLSSDQASVLCGLGVSMPLDIVCVSSASVYFASVVVNGTKKCPFEEICFARFITSYTQKDQVYKFKYKYPSIDCFPL